ncbi:MAG: type II toxin-antitoxin system PemK/MazF family toxin [Baekduia sp.]
MTTDAVRPYPGDFSGMPPVAYEPSEDGDPDPGEVVWSWVPFEEDHTRGKDRPVLIVGRDSDWLLGLPVTSKDHDRDAAQEAAEGRLWVDIGAGAWDPSGRPSEARINRVVRLAPAAVRREGGALPRERYGAVVTAMRTALA